MKTLVLIAAFHAYSGQLMNYAQETMLYAKQLQKEFPELQIETCKPLTVSAKRAMPEVMKCLEKREKRGKAKPDFLILLGESSGCQITLETDAANFFDAKGERVADADLKPNRIEANGDNWRKGTLPFDQLFCQYKKTESSFTEKIPVTVGPSDKNTFVCNLLNYQLADELKDSTLPYGFIHLPHLGCTFHQSEKPVRPPHIAKSLLTLLSGLNKNQDCKVENEAFEQIHQEKWQAANQSLLNLLKTISGN